MEGLCGKKIKGSGKFCSASITTARRRYRTIVRNTIQRVPTKGRIDARGHWRDHIVRDFSRMRKGLAHRNWGYKVALVRIALVGRRGYRVFRKVHTFFPPRSPLPPFTTAEEEPEDNEYNDRNACNPPYDPTCNCTCMGFAAA